MKRWVSRMRMSRMRMRDEEVGVPDECRMSARMKMRDEEVGVPDEDADECPDEDEG
jgi:hypothetical protein